LIYPNELEIKDTTECSTSASSLDTQALMSLVGGLILYIIGPIIYIIRPPSDIS
jgi:predicted membrane channel-forming protein YqfA (hemolysin III family)